jgi:hypothetical protein
MATTARDKVREALQKALTSQPTGRVRQSDVRSALEEHRGLVEKALKKGHSRTALAKLLRANGVGASIETIRAYIGDVLNNESANSKAAKPKTRERGPVKIHDPARTTGDFKTLLDDDL